MLIRDFTNSVVEGDSQGGLCFSTRLISTPASASVGVRGFTRSRGATAFHTAPVGSRKGNLSRHTTGAMLPRKPDAVEATPASGFALKRRVLPLHGAPLTPAGLPSRRGFDTSPARSRSHLTGAR